MPICWTPTSGSPQGAVVSPLLANIYLHELDVEMRQVGLVMVRYADDAVVLCRTREEAEAALARMRAWVQANGLKLHPNKTHVGRLQAGDEEIGGKLVHARAVEQPPDDRAVEIGQGDREQDRVAQFGRAIGGDAQHDRWRDANPDNLPLQFEVAGRPEVTVHGDLKTLAGQDTEFNFALMLQALGVVGTGDFAQIPERRTIRCRELICGEQRVEAAGFRLETDDAVRHRHPGNPEGMPAIFAAMLWLAGFDRGAGIILMNFPADIGEGEPVGKIVLQVLSLRSLDTAKDCQGEDTQGGNTPPAHADVGADAM